MCLAAGKRKKENGGCRSGPNGGPGGVLAKVHSSGGRTRRVSGVKSAGNSRSDLIFLGFLPHWGALNGHSVGSCGLILQEDVLQAEFVW